MTVKLFSIVFFHCVSARDHLKFAQIYMIFLLILLVINSSVRLHTLVIVTEPADVLKKAD